MVSIQNIESISKFRLTGRVLVTYIASACSRFLYHIECSDSIAKALVERLDSKLPVSFGNNGDALQGIVLPSQDGNDELSTIRGNLQP